MDEKFAKIFIQAAKSFFFKLFQLNPSQKILNGCLVFNNFVDFIRFLLATWLLKISE